MNQANDNDGGPWLKVWISLGKHHKVLALKNELDLNSRQEALGFLIDFWFQTFINCWKDGDWSKWSPADVEEIVGYRGEAGTLIKALQKTGWIDGMKVHDWDKAASGIIKRRTGAGFSQTKKYTGPVDDSLAVRERTRLFNKQIEK